MMTMTSPRKTSAETSRGRDEESGEAFLLKRVTDGELAAVTMPHLCENMSMLRLCPY